MQLTIPDWVPRVVATSQVLPLHNLVLDYPPFCLQPVEDLHVMVKRFKKRPKQQPPPPPLDYRLQPIPTLKKPVVLNFMSSVSGERLGSLEVELPWCCPKKLEVLSWRAGLDLKLLRIHVDSQPKPFLSKHLRSRKTLHPLEMSLPEGLPMVQCSNTQEKCRS